MQDKWSIRDVAEALIKHGLIEKQTEQELRDCKTCIHSNKGNCAGTEECHECMWESKYEQQPCDDAISRQAVLKQIDQWAIGNREYLPTNAMHYLTKRIQDIPPVNPQNCDNCEVGNPCLYCRHEFEPQERSDKA